MPSLNRIKQFGAGEYYHVYNRGVEKRVVFVDSDDYSYFLGLIKRYVLPRPPWEGEYIRRNYSGRIRVYSFCLMPNHYHLLIQQTGDFDMTNFMRSLMTAYVRYFNEKYGRVGSLFQDCYKAVRVGSSEQLNQLIQYIELNPSNLISDVKNYPYSSLYFAADTSWISLVRTGYDPLSGRTPEQLSGVEGAKAL